MGAKQHTPGPWFIAYGGLEGDDHFTIASRISPGSVADYAVAAPRPSAEVIANARPIAAAPELLEALKQCAAVCAGETFHKGGLVAALEAARNAIAKAINTEATR